MADSKGSWGNQAGYADQWNKKGPGQGSAWDNIKSEIGSMVGNKPASANEARSDAYGDALKAKLSQMKSKST